MVESPNHAKLRIPAIETYAINPISTLSLPSHPAIFNSSHWQTRKYECYLAPLHQAICGIVSALNTRLGLATNNAITSCNLCLAPDIGTEQVIQTSHQDMQWYVRLRTRVSDHERIAGSWRSGKCLPDNL